MAKEMQTNRGGKIPHVAVLLGSYAGYGRNLIRGVAAYARESGPWQLLFEAYGQLPSLRHVDGIIMRPVQAVIAQRKRPPSVIVATSKPVAGIPVIMADQGRVAALAAEHFSDLGLHHCAFAGSGSPAAKLRLAGYRKAILETGGTLHEFSHDIRTELAPATWQETMREMQRWVRTLPKPVGIFASEDECARQVLMACQSSGVLVPEEAAILGVDNDDLICEITHPSLSSIDHGAFDIGYRAAGILHRMMDGEKITEDIMTVPPRALVVRQSTDMMAMQDTRVRDAVRFIREHTRESISVNDVATHVALGRRHLEVLFSKELKRTIHDEIVRQRINRAKQLLAETDRSMEWIAENSGYNYLSRLSAQFKAETGLTPMQYRRQARSRGDGMERQ